MINIVHSLRMSRGTNAKLKILQEHKDNAMWKAILLAMYDTSINYYVSAPNDNVFKTGEVDSAGMLLRLQDLTERKYTGKKAREFALMLSREYGEIARLVLGGSLKAGVSVTTINKAYPGLIPTFDLMLALNVEVESFPIWGCIKYDGVRVVATVGDGPTRIQTRSGKSLPIKSLLAAFDNLSPGVYDGELVKGNGKQESRTKISGEVTKVLRGTWDDLSDYSCVVFDKVSLDDWFNKKCTIPYSLRLRELNNENIPIGYIRIITHEEFNSVNEINDAFDEYIGAGYEGMMLRYPEDMYMWSRSKKLIKKKAIYGTTLVCTEIIPGTGKYMGMIGAIRCVGIVDEKQVSVKVGTGFSDEDRNRSPEDYLNERIEIDYNDITLASGSDLYSLFLPRFKRIATNIDI